MKPRDSLARLPSVFQIAGQYGKRAVLEEKKCSAHVWLRQWSRENIGQQISLRMATVLGGDARDKSSGYPSRSMSGTRISSFSFIGQRMHGRLQMTKPTLPPPPTCRCAQIAFDMKTPVLNCLSVIVWKTTHHLPNSKSGLNCSWASNGAPVPNCVLDTMFFIKDYQKLMLWLTRTDHLHSFKAGKVFWFIYA